MSDSFVSARVLTGELQQRIEKAITPDVLATSNQVVKDDYQNAFTNLGALDPVYDPEMLALIFEHSNSLRQNVDSYATNIDGFGHRFDPVFDLNAADVHEKVGHAMEQEAGYEEKEPTPEEVDARLKSLKKEMIREEVKLKHFFENCCFDISFVSLRRRTRQDLEVMGNAFWEVLRNRKGEIAQFVYVPGFSIRLLPLDNAPTPLKRLARVSQLSMEEVEYQSRLRKFVQLVEGKSVFFKELGDPRIISCHTGKIYKDEKEMLFEEPNSKPATELLHFKIHSPRTAYGVPRWIGNLLAVIGSRQAEEVNFNYFENKSVPPLAILVSGGRMSQDSVSRVSEYIEANLKGKRNFHKILVLEAEGGGSASDANASKMKIELKPLTGAQNSDAQFQQYDERNIDKVGQAFRLPRLLRGDIRDANRSTSESALTFAEVQVFEPERQEFDFIINRRILSAMGICFWRFVSLAPVLRDALGMSEIIRNLSNANVLTPEEARELAGDVFNRDFRRINAAWVKQPGAFTIAGIPVAEGKPGEPIPQPDPNFRQAGSPVLPEKDPAEGIVENALQKKAIKILKMREALEEAKESAYRKYLMDQAMLDAA